MMIHLLHDAGRPGFETPPGGSFGAEVEAILEIVERWHAGQEVFILHTSGSTGKPKAMRFSRNQLERSARQTAHAFELEAGDAALLCLPVRYVAGFMMVIRALHLGLHLYAEPSRREVAQQASPAVDFAALLPMQLESSWEAADSWPPALAGAKAVLLGGAPIPKALSMRLREEAPAPVYHTYGMTETLTHVAVRRLDGQHQTDLFSALSGVRFSTDERACLVVDNPVTEAPVVTNDRVKLLDGQHFQYLGRIDNVINSGGLKLQLEEVEARCGAVLRASGWLKPGQAFFAFAAPDAELGQRLELAMDCDGESVAAANAEAIREILRQSMPRHHAPKTVHLLPVFRYTETGKIDRKGTIRLIEE